MSSFKTIISHCGVIHIARRRRLAARGIPVAGSRLSSPQICHRGRRITPEHQDLSGGTYSPDEGGLPVVINPTKRPNQSPNHPQDPRPRPIWALATTTKSDHDTLKLPN